MGGRSGTESPGGGLFREREHADNASPRTVVFEANLPRGSRKQGIVLPEPDVFSRLETTTTLPDEDGAALDAIPVKSLHAEALGLAISTVP